MSEPTGSNGKLDRLFSALLAMRRHTLFALQQMSAATRQAQSPQHQSPV
jgi:hypothetical protein